MRITVFGMLVMVLGCNRGESKLRTRVDSFCSQLRSEVVQATTQYEKYADALRGNQVVQRGDFEAALAVESIGTTGPVRRARLRDISERFQFCVLTRRFDENRGEQLQARSQAIAEQLNAPAVLEDPGQTVQLLKQYSSLVHELDSTPFIE